MLKQVAAHFIVQKSFNRIIILNARYISIFGFIEMPSVAHALWGVWSVEIGTRTRTVPPDGNCSNHPDLSHSQCFLVWLWLLSGCSSSAEEAEARAAIRMGAEEVTSPAAHSTCATCPPLVLWLGLEARGWKTWDWIHIHAVWFAVFSFLLYALHSKLCCTDNSIPAKNSSFGFLQAAGGDSGITYESSSTALHCESKGGTGSGSCGCVRSKF